MAVAHLLADRNQSTHPLTFIQIGAFDGATGDPLHQLITKQDWAGVAVEPQPEAFARLVSRYAPYSRIQCENVAIADSNGTRQLFCVDWRRTDVPEWAYQLASFDRRTILRHRKYLPNIHDLLVTKEVQCITLADLAKKHGIDKVDLLLIDTEGYDADIVLSIPFYIFCPRLICFEHKHLPIRRFNACCELLVSKGYKIAIGPQDAYAYCDTSDPSLARPLDH